MRKRRFEEAVVVGSGPNGLAAAITLARAGLRVKVIEGSATIGGGLRSAALTLPGFLHDVCSAVHPLAVASPFFRSVPLQELGVEFIHPGVPFAHPLEDGTAAVAHRSLEETADGLGADGPAYLRLLRPVREAFPQILEGVFDPLRLPRHPLVMARFGLDALRSAEGITSRFKGEAAPALFAGAAAHSCVPLDRAFTAGFGLMLAGAAHAVGWPIPRGGSQRLADALATHLRSLGGSLETGRLVERVEELPEDALLLFDVTPRQLVKIAGSRLSPGYLEGLARYRYGPGVFKIDYALDGPIPWTAKACGGAGTVHVGGRFEEIARSERESASGRIPERPYLLVVQQSLFDDSRAPAGQQTAWVYCHVPNGCPEDMTARIEAQLERFAPGFRDRVLARHTRGPAQLEAYNPNLVGGDIAGGASDVLQLFARPVAKALPWATSDARIFLCSSSTPPANGVHGMCGVLAAQAALATMQS